MPEFNKIKKIEDVIKIKFNCFDLLKQVFIHRSYLNEHKETGLEHNERLEFLGDAVLELIVTEFLYKKYSDPEGVLTNWRSALVKGDNLSKLAQKLNIDDYMLLSKGEKASTGKSRKIILANALEALIGAIYLDQGYDVAKKFVRDNLIIDLPKIIEHQLYIDAKSQFQEIVQEKFGITPHYELISETGPDHAKKFIMGVYLKDDKIGEGNGSSKQEAEQEAAREGLKKYSSQK